MSQVLGPQEQCLCPFTDTVKHQTKFFALNMSVIVLDFDLSLKDNWLCPVKWGQDRVFIYSKLKLSLCYSELTDLL